MNSRESERRDMRDISLGERILLATRFGEFQLQHVSADGKSGIALASNLDSSECYVRVQSSCLFSESLASIDCDCADQLTRAIELIGVRGGCLVYTFEEGRGAGLEAKIRAIGLQQRWGIDTVAAYRELGMPPDLRNYDFAALVLRHITADRPVVLLTNNPAKVRELAARGINISRREPLVAVDSPMRKRYLEEKSKILGHLITEDARE
jgi:GTP cyclohydrolase II